MNSKINSIQALLSVIKNGQKNGLLVVPCKKSKIAKNILHVLCEQGYIQGYRNGVNFSGSASASPVDHRLEILLKYKSLSQNGVITTCKLISKPSKKKYITCNELKQLVSFNVPTFLKNKTSSKATNNSFNVTPSNVYHDILGNANLRRNPKQFLNGIYLLSTNQGIVSHETAIKANMGGLLLCHIA